MDEPPASRASQVLRALADLAPSGEQHTSALAVPTEWFRWLPLSALRVFNGQEHPTQAARVDSMVRSRLAFDAPEVWGVAIDRQFGERLAAVDQIRAGQGALRVGWLFVAGRLTAADGRTRRVFHPLVRIPVRVQRSRALGGAHLVPSGDIEITDLVADRDRHNELESHIEFGGGALHGSDIEAAPALLVRLDRLAHYARSLASAAGLPANKVIPATDGPDGFMRGDRLAIVAGVGVYAIHEVGESSRASSLRGWASGPLDRWTAFHSLYLDAPDDVASDGKLDLAVESPFLLTPVQSQAIARSRHDPITLISGAPGTGKSHTIAAIACDALANGERVLVAAKSDATVDALLDLLDRPAGPDPVVFGSNERRQALTTRLSEGQVQPVGDEAVSAARRNLEATTHRRDELRASVTDRLAAEVLLTEASGTDTSAAVLGARTVAPGLFDPDADLLRVDALLAAVASPAIGWLSRRRQRKARLGLVELAQAPPAVNTEEIRAALTMARAQRACTDLLLQGGLEIGPLWDELRRDEDAARTARGNWLAAVSRSEERLNASALRAVAALATALRSGRAARRQQLSRLDDDKLTQALPLWVGTLADVDDLLPPVAALFDLVILDEASSIDQPLAATALLRGGRAVIAGDPRQLRQVSFVSDAQLREVVTTYGLDDSPTLAARLDIRRNSTFDLAAGAAPVVVLTEHFRSDPHLVDFVARRLYDGKVQVATRSPTTESRNCVDVGRTDGRRDKNGVVAAEVDRVIVELKASLKAGRHSVGVVTPFRAQADAIEAAALAAFSADDLEAMDLRVGTVHSFQGNERDLIIASVGIGPEESGASWRFVEDPHLFAVFMTRARRRMIILVSADPPEGGLVAAYLAQADDPPGPPKAAGTLGPWAASIAADLRSAGVSIMPAYPTGRHVVDICIGDERRNLYIECGVHPDGPGAHVDRHLALSRRGWESVEAYRSRWGDRRAELIVELLGSLMPR